MPEQKELPNEVLELLNLYNAPERLTRHLTLVYNVAMEITKRMTTQWPKISMDPKAICFGAATHDIGKISVPQELYEQGNRHEEAGYLLLIGQGVSDEMARFARTHGHWEHPENTLEDLVVSLADKIWKGKRVDGLEEKLCGKISEATGIDYWTVHPDLDAMINGIVLGADERIGWQNGAG